jgi:hypothetical protein
MQESTNSDDFTKTNSINQATLILATTVISSKWRIFMISGKMFLLTMTSIVFLLGTSLASVVINEVEQDPAGKEDAFKAWVTAWFELFNNDNKDVDIGGWSINNSIGGSMTFPKGTIVKAIDYYVLDVPPKWLAHGGEVLRLTDASGIEVDRTPALGDKEDNEGSWTRDPDGRDTNSTDDWKFLPSSRGF